MWFLNRFDINRHVQPHKMARFSLNFRIYNRNCTIQVAKSKVLISCAVTAQLICDFFFFAYANILFSYDVAHIHYTTTVAGCLGCTGWFVSGLVKTTKNISHNHTGYLDNYMYTSCSHLHRFHQHWLFSDMF